MLWRPLEAATPLLSAYGSGGPETQAQFGAGAKAISGDGRVVVGVSYRVGESDRRTIESAWQTIESHRPTIWEDSVPRFLPASQGLATSVSHDGRVIGGGQNSTPYGPEPVVWMDEVPTPLVNPDGTLAKGGSVVAVVNGIDGDPSSWIALSTAKGSTLSIAFSDGIAHPLDSWLSENYDIAFKGIQDWVGMDYRDGALHLLAVLYREDALEAFDATHQLHHIVVPVTARGALATSEPLDVNGNGTIEPLDALFVINVLNQPFSETAAEGEATDLPSKRVDVNRDGTVQPLDALLIINVLNAGTSPHTEMTLESMTSEPATPEGESESLLALAADEYFASLTKRRRNG